MYQITRELAEYLLIHSRNPQIPGIQEGETKPFIPRNLNAIGIIDPFVALGTNLEYVVHCDYDVKENDELVYSPPIVGCWLYHASELKSFKEPVHIKRGDIDPYTTNLEEQFDVTDCSVEIPAEVDRLTATKVETLERLLEIEPKIKDCLDQETHTHVPWFSQKF
jgi:hypothetical protein